MAPLFPPFGGCSRLRLYVDGLLNDVVYEQQGNGNSDWKPLAGKTFADVLNLFGADRWELASMIVLSDHGHHSRPAKTVNINKFLKDTGYTASKDNRMWMLSKVRKSILDVSHKLNIEHALIRIMAKSGRLSKAGKSVYSSAGSIDRTKSRAFLSNFAGIKSYPFGGIEINHDAVSSTEYAVIRNALIAALSELRSPAGVPLMKWTKAREDVDSGRFSERMYPDILFELSDGYGVGWDLDSGLYGKAKDHQVASGGHNRDAVLLLRNVDRKVRDDVVSIINVAPTILDLFEIDWQPLGLDGVSILES